MLAFNAPYLPWVLLSFSLLLGHDVTSDLLGIAVGHLYFFFEDVFPALAVARGWGLRRPLGTPYVLHFLFGTRPRATPQQPAFVNAVAAAAPPPPPPPPP